MAATAGARYPQRFMTIRASHRLGVSVKRFCYQKCRIYPHADQAAEKVLWTPEMAKVWGSKMYPRGPAIAYSASNRVGNFALGIDKDFFRSL